MNDLISIIVPVYNVSKYLSKCLDSIINQTHRNLQIILVDDGSSDRSGMICDEYATRDNRIEVIHKVNGGVSAARNVGLDKAIGDYIGFVDGDDWIELDMYEYLMKNAKEFDADISRCGLYINSSDGSQIPGSFSEDNIRVLNQTEALKEIVTSLENATGCNKIIKAEIAKSICFDEGITYSEDWKYNYLIAKKSNVFVFSEKPEYHYLKRSDSSTNDLDEKNIESGMNVFEFFYNSEKDNPEIFPYVCRGYFWEASTITIRAVFVGKTNTKVFKKYMSLLRSKENIIKSYLTENKQRLRLMMMCRCMWLYKLNLLLRYHKKIKNT